MMDDTMIQMSNDYRAAAEDLLFFDANVWLGRPEGFPLAEELLADRLNVVLKENFITGCLLSHWRGKTLSPRDGNKALEELPLSSSENRYAVWTGLPLFPVEPGPLPGIGEIPPSVRGVRIFPKSHNFPLTAWILGSLCERLIKDRLPLFIRHTELDWSSLYELAKAFPELAIIIETQPQKILYHTRPLFAIMKECNHVFVELSNFTGPGFIEFAVREFGARRLVFGSFLPMNDPWVPMGMILDAEISRDDKKLIAGGNLRRLIGEAR